MSSQGQNSVSWKSNTHKEYCDMHVFVLIMTLRCHCSLPFFPVHVDFQELPAFRSDLGLTFASFFHLQREQGWVNIGTQPLSLSLDAKPPFVGKTSPGNMNVAATALLPSAPDQRKHSDLVPPPETSTLSLATPCALRNLSTLAETLSKGLHLSLKSKANHTLCPLACSGVLLMTLLKASALAMRCHLMRSPLTHKLTVVFLSKESWPCSIAPHSKPFAAS